MGKARGCRTTLPGMGLDIYAGPICRYVAGEWMTVVQWTGLAEASPSLSSGLTSQRMPSATLKS